jgi:molybdopterin molybdotransferase
MNDNEGNYTKNYMVTFQEALDLIAKNTDLLDSEKAPYEECFGRVLVSDIKAPYSIPSFNNSAMDGYAVRAIDLVNASQTSPKELTIKSLSAAGDLIDKKSNAQSSLENSACKIMTGAAVPDGYDSIIPVENTSLKGEQVSCFSSPLKGAHIRKIGQDFEQGIVIAKQSDTVNENHIMAFAALGLAEVEVYKRPNIALFSTGKELIDDANIELKPGQIRNSNKPYLLSYLKNKPVNVFNAGTNLDQVDDFEKSLSKQLESNTNIIISTGAVSMGDFDFIPSTIQKLGGDIIFHKTKIRPGKPILFAKFPNGTIYFGLPGNPISANIGLRFFVMHCLRKMLSLNTEQPVKAKLNHSHSKKHSFVGFQKANAYIDKKGIHKVNILDGQESFKIQPLLNANGWAVLYEDKHSWEKSDVIDFYPS